jgi:SHS2 domain-containing protein
MSAGFELVDHTADVAVRAWGASAEEVFEQAAAGMASLLYDSATVAAREPHTLSLEAPDGELLLAAWLNELLFLIEARGVVFARFEVESLTGGAFGTKADTIGAAAVSAVRLQATAVGEAFDGRRHSIRSVVKAATLHGLRLEQNAGGWEGLVLLDV